MSRYPWGEEAINKAKAEDKPIFLSIGYSTCHWCHVMERESFENEEIAEILNKYYISIKVDREERPDVDRVYMTFVQATTGSGGWPLSVWLTPCLKPIFGGTYFPPDNRYYNRPGFKTLLLLTADKWQRSRKEIEDKGTAIVDALEQGTQILKHEHEDLPTIKAIYHLYEMLEKVYDEKYGGFGKAPKFPQPVNFNALLRFYNMERETEYGKKALNMCLHTLRMIAKGGIHDHIGQGFHRYSTDRIWHVPHFEKMLYDQAQLVISYLDAYQITKEEVFAKSARDIFEYVNRDLSHPEGGFYSAEDADSLLTADSEEKKEGAFYVWEWDELHSLLKDRVSGADSPLLAEVFCHHYGCEKKGNVDPLQDPHEELIHKNVLIVRGSVQETAVKFGMDEEKVNTALAKCHQILYQERQRRPRPHLDDKMVAAWNGLMVSGMARGGQVLGDATLTAHAIKAAEFLKTYLFIEESNTLLRSCYAGMEGIVTQLKRPIEGFADDYAFVIRGLLDLFECSQEIQWLQLAERLQFRQDELFWDEEGGGYYNSQSKDPSIVIRMKEDQDGAEPSPNSVACMNLLRLSNLLDNPSMQEKAVCILRLFSHHLDTVPVAVPELVSCLTFYLRSPKQIIIVGPSEGEDTKEMLHAVHSRFIPNKILVVTDGIAKNCLHGKLGLSTIDGKATAYVCENFACASPTNSLQDFEKQLDFC
ncbi:hypothetical protein C0Q70_01517 [Pomacea canaliculata]|uniref:Spermatogenesis-associated protein 20-like TRX domain-containing protein n=1 Tax=Pomacea canaliculata TaxID=400727 RepID=A0A2T7PZQ1_POMCA|nr:hypothetical protein C0Q70_01517 [Pomacea canaliculata]